MREGRRFSLGSWRVFYDFTGNSSRVAVVVPKSLISSAVERNSLRREVFQLLSKDLPQLGEVRIIFRLMSSKNTSLQPEDIARLFERLEREIGREGKDA